MLLGLVALAGCSDSTALAPDVSQSNAEISTDGNIDGHYIVVADWDADAPSLATEYGIKPRHTYEHLLNGFAGEIPDDVVQRLAADPRVLRISVQREVTKLETVTQTGATWGLDRIDQRLLPLDGTYTYEFTAHKVHAYIIDTGIRYDHAEFEGRAQPGFDAFKNDPTDAILGAQAGYDGSGDCEGHGTHVAGTVGGKTFGVAKQVKLVGVRVLNCIGYGSDADVIAGMDWVAKNGVLPAVANMSLGDIVPSKAVGLSTEIDNAVKAMIASGVTVAIAAGNGYGLGAAPGYNSCDYPLANIREALVVGASRNNDQQTAWTSFGPCVGVYAPGQTIRSALHDNATASGTKSGTSMATPHVAGVAALVLAQAPGATPAEVQQVVVNDATPNVLQKNTLNTTAAADPTPLLLLHSRSIVPDNLKGKHGSSKPCTPKRQRSGECSG
jgi:subtilisin family serine protease